MAYTSPNTFSATAVIVSEDVQDNLDQMKKYVNGSAIAADLRTSSTWVEDKHLMRGHYNPLSNMHDFVSGVAGGFNSHPDDESWVCDGPTARADPTSPDFKSYPNTGIEFFLETPADVLFRFNASPITPDDLYGDKNYTRVSIYLNDTRIQQSRMVTTDDRNLTLGGLSDPSAMWQQWHNFYFAKNLAAGWHSIALRGYTKRRYSFLVDWNCTLEAYYL